MRPSQLCPAILPLGYCQLKRFWRSNEAQRTLLPFFFEDNVTNSADFWSILGICVLHRAVIALSSHQTQLSHPPHAPTVARDDQNDTSSECRFSYATSVWECCADVLKQFIITSPTSKASISRQALIAQILQQDRRIPPANVGTSVD